MATRRPGLRSAIGLVAALAVATILAGSAHAIERDATQITVRRVRIVDFSYSPRTITVSRGTRVRWTNAGATPHTVSSNAGTWGSGTLASGDVFRRVFRRAGSFSYHCTFHPTMRGMVIVT